MLRLWKSSNVSIMGADTMLQGPFTPTSPLIFSIKSSQFAADFRTKNKGLGQCALLAS